MQTREGIQPKSLQYKLPDFAGRGDAASPRIFRGAGIARSPLTLLSKKITRKCMRLPLSQAPLINSQPICRLRKSFRSQKIRCALGKPSGHAKPRGGTSRLSFSRFTILRSAYRGKAAFFTPEPASSLLNAVVQRTPLRAPSDGSSEKGGLHHSESSRQSRSGTRQAAGKWIASLLWSLTTTGSPSIRKEPALGTAATHTNPPTPLIRPSTSVVCDHYIGGRKVYRNQYRHVYRNRYVACTGSDTRPVSDSIHIF